MNESFIDYLRLLLLPFSLLYGVVIRVRNALYDWGWLKQIAFDLPVIVVGNLEAGGTGKSPMIEYMIRLLGRDYKLATLSRGYGRQSRGYLEVHPESTASFVGDEPLQFKRKFPNITVAVCERRVLGVRRLKESHDLVLLDDAYQHRSLKPGLSVLLFNYGSFTRFPFLLPAGNFRDNFSARGRADVMVVTKCPIDLGSSERQQLQQWLAVRGKKIPVLFSTIAYGELEPLGTKVSAKTAHERPSLKGKEILLVTGIARPQPFLDYIRAQGAEVEHIPFSDHHTFTPQDLAEVRRRFQDLAGERKLILTTEKDAVRLADKSLQASLHDLPIYFVPIRLNFIESDGQIFRELLSGYLRTTISS